MKTDKGRGIKGTGWFFNRDKASLEPSGSRTKTLEESDNLPDPDVLAQEIVVPRLASLGTTPSQGKRPSSGPRRRVEDLEAALEQFREIATDQRAEVPTENCSP